MTSSGSDHLNNSADDERTTRDEQHITYQQINHSSTRLGIRKLAPARKLGHYQNFRFSPVEARTRIQGRLIRRDPPRPRRRHQIETSPGFGFHSVTVAGVHSNIGAIFASTSSRIASGMLSSFRPPRAARSRARGWSHRTTPIVLVPAPVSGTAKPAVRAKLPPLVIGRITGTFVMRLKASGDTISTGRRP